MAGKQVGQTNLTLMQSSLRQLRLERGFSQEALCNDFYTQNVQVSLATIKRAESGKPVSARVAKAVADYFSVNLKTIVQNANVIPVNQKQHKPIFMFVILLRPVGFFSCDALNRQSTFKHIHQALGYADIHVVNISGNYVCGYSYSIASLHALLRILEREIVQGELLEGHFLSCVLMRSEVELSSHSIHLNQSDLHFAEALLQAQNRHGLYLDGETRLKTIHEYQFELLANEGKLPIWRYLQRVDTRELVLGSEGYGEKIKAIVANQRNVPSNCLINIEGCAGSGKSHLLRNYFQSLNQIYNGILIKTLDVDKNSDFSVIKQLARQLVFDQSGNSSIFDQLTALDPKFASLIEHCATPVKTQGLESSHALWEKVVESILSLSNLDVLCIDDADKCDFESMALLLRLLKKQRVHLILVNANPNWLSKGVDREITRVVMAPLQDKSVCKLAQNWYEGELSASAIQFLKLSTQGNPLLLQQLLTSTDLFEIDTKRFIIARVQMLPEESKVTLSRIALLGFTIEATMLPYVNVQTQVIEDFCQAGILKKQTSDRFEFVHLGIFEYVRNHFLSSSFEYEAKQCLTRLVQREISDSQSHLELAAKLYLQLKQYEAAGDCVFRLSLAAQKAGYFEFALASIVEALSSMQDKLPRELLLKLRLMQLSLIKARFGWNSPQLAVLNRLIEQLCNDDNHNTGKASLLFNQWLFHLMGLNFEQSLVTAETLVQFATAQNDECALQQGYIAVSNSYFWLGEARKSVTFAQKAIEHYSKGFKQRELTEFGHDSRVLALLFLVLNHSICGDRGKADYFDAKLANIVAEVNAFSLAISLQAKLFLFYHFDEPIKVLAIAKQLKSLAMAQQFPFFTGIAYLFLGWSHGSLFSASDGLTYLEEGYHEWLAKSGGRLSYSVYMCMRSELLLKLGKKEQTADELLLAINECKRNQELTYLSLLTFFLFKAKSYEKTDSAEDSELIVKAIEIAERQNALALIDKFERHTIREENEKTRC